MKNPDTLTGAGVRKSSRSFITPSSRVPQDLQYEESNVYPNHVWDTVGRKWLHKEDIASSNGCSGKRENWPDPKPLPDGLLPVAAFDEAFLPESLRPWAMDIADRMQCPPEFVAVPRSLLAAP